MTRSVYKAKKLLDKIHSDRMDRWFEELEWEKPLKDLLNDHEECISFLQALVDGEDDPWWYQCRAKEMLEDFSK